MLSAWFGLSMNGFCMAANAPFDKGVALYKQRKYEEAAKCFSDAAANGQNPSAYYYQANCQCALGHRQEAVKLYQYIISRFPTTNEAYYAKSALKQIDSSNPRSSQAPTSASPPESTTNAPTSNVSSAKLSKEQLIGKLLKVNRSQGNRPDVSAALINEVKDTLTHCSTGLLALLVAKHCIICLTPSTIDQDPRMQNTKPSGYEEGTTYKNCPGFFDGEHIVVCQYAAYGSDDSNWQPTEDPLGTLRHELGHAFDYCLDNISEAEEFKHAYYLDMGQVPDEVKPQIAYFLQPSDHGLHEAFAELVCYQFGGRNRHQDRCALVHSSFKRAAAIVQQKIDGFDTK